ncbi:histidine phosphatase family protein [Pleionea sp. CnH1-48]|uniref:SixA phosphatase family protein n=1 Tax=Pleionea sp. CnH1-48 TaxID=2954494 RepID=UPI0020978531|nr:histidine phosphatase family protein [Pleionea sp. CnH1-48]MCO7226857.1 histidine phosphatase family protein [Pleionea sp. CnH1-48]
MASNKSLTLVRHAKSSWKFPELDDFERPLNKRGHRNAPKIAERLNEVGLKPDCIISSPAVRALSTAQIIADILLFERKRIIEHPDLYHASVKTLIGIICQQDDNLKHLMIVGHNPTLNDLLWMTDVDIDNLPTCGVVNFSLDIESWSSFSHQALKLEYYDYPKRER